MFSLLLNRHLGLELLDYRVNLCLTCKETAKVFSKVSAPHTVSEGSCFCASSLPFGIILPLIMVILADVKCPLYAKSSWTQPQILMVFIYILLVNPSCGTV